MFPHGQSHYGAMKSIMGAMCCNAEIQCSINDLRVIRCMTREITRGVEQHLGEDREHAGLPWREQMESTLQRFAAYVLFARRRYLWFRNLRSTKSGERPADAPWLWTESAIRCRRSSNPIRRMFGNAAFEIDWKPMVRFALFCLDRALLEQEEEGNSEVSLQSEDSLHKIWNRIVERGGDTERDNLDSELELPLPQFDAKGFHEKMRTGNRRKYEDRLRLACMGINLDVVAQYTRDVMMQLPATVEEVNDASAVEDSTTTMTDLLLHIKRTIAKNHQPRISDNEVDMVFRLVRPFVVEFCRRSRAEGGEGRERGEKLQFMYSIYNRHQKAT